MNLILRIFFPFSFINVAFIYKTKYMYVLRYLYGTNKFKTFNNIIIFKKIFLPSA